MAEERAKALLKSVEGKKRPADEAEGAAEQASGKRRQKGKGKDKSKGKQR